MRDGGSALARRWNARLETWAEYIVAGERGGKVKISSAYRLGARGTRGDGDGIPIHVGEALDTDALYWKLAEHLRRAVWAWYCEPGTAGEKAARLSIHRDTLSDRVRAAWRTLDDMHGKRAHSKNARMSPHRV